MPARRIAVLAAAALVSLTLTAPAAAAPGPRHRPRQPAVTVTPGGTTSGIDIALLSAVGISGRVLSANGRPIDTAAVSIFSAAGNRIGRAAAGEDGTFHAAQLPAARGYYVCAIHHGAALVRHSATGHLGRCVGSSGDYDGSAPVPGATVFRADAGGVVPDVTVRLPAGAAVSGRLVAADTGDEVGGLTIEIHDAAGHLVRTGAVDGVYQVLGLVGGDYQICVRPTSQVYDSATGARGTGYLGRCARHVHLVAGHHRSDLVLRLPVAAAVRGTVLGKDDLPVQSAVVRIFHNRRFVTSARTGAGGGFDLGGLRTGRYRVCAHAGHAGRSPVRYNLPRCSAVRLVAGRTTQDVTLRPQRSAQRFGALAGTVRNEQGAALRGITVDVYDVRGRYRDTTSTAADGSYRVGGLPVGDYQVCFGRTAGGTPGRYAPVCSFSTPWSQVTLPADPTLVPVSAGRTWLGVDAALPVAGMVTGTVTGAGRPLGRQTVWLLSASGRVIDWRWTDDRGTYHFGGLAAVPRGYRVCVSAPLASDTTNPAADLAPDTGLRSQCYGAAPWRHPLAPISR